MQLLGPQPPRTGSQATVAVAWLWEGWEESAKLAGIAFADPALEMAADEDNRLTSSWRNTCPHMGDLGLTVSTVMVLSWALTAVSVRTT